jgi:hypothetical protein
MNLQPNSVVQNASHDSFERLACWRNPAGIAEGVIRNLPSAEQKDLVHFIIRQISVKHFDPSTDPTPRETGVFATKIRTKWYLVNLSLYASDLFTDRYKSGEISSDFKKIGSRGRARTCNPPVNSRLLYH